jgi:hypothetical protein
MTLRFPDLLVCDEPDTEYRLARPMNMGAREFLLIKTLGACFAGDAFRVTDSDLELATESGLEWREASKRVVTDPTAKRRF